MPMRALVPWLGAVPDLNEDARAGLGAAPRRIVDHQAAPADPAPPTCPRCSYARRELLARRSCRRGARSDRRRRSCVPASQLRVAVDLVRLEAERPGDAEDAGRRALVALVLHRLILPGEVIEVLGPTDAGGADDGGLGRPGALPGGIGRRTCARRCAACAFTDVIVGHGDDDEARCPVQRTRDNRLLSRAARRRGRWRRGGAASACEARGASTSAVLKMRRSTIRSPLHKFYRSCAGARLRSDL